RRSSDLGQLTGYTVRVAGNDITIEKDEFGSTAVEISGADAGAVAAGIANGTGDDGEPSAAAELVLDEFSVTVGDGDAVNLAGTYATASDLVDAINTRLDNTTAWIDGNGHLVIASSESLTIEGDGAAQLGIAEETVSASGVLTGISVLSESAANDAIIRVDEAL